MFHTILVMCYVVKHFREFLSRVKFNQLYALLFSALLLSFPLLNCCATDFAPQPRWHGNVFTSFKVGTQRNIGQMGLLIPVAQSVSDMTFMDLRGMLDSRQNKEANVGLGYRTMSSSWIHGFYAFFDRRKSQFDNHFSEIAVGFEKLSPTWEGRINYYQPISKRREIRSKSQETYFRFGHDKVATMTSYDVPLKGMDIEVGRRIIEGLKLFGGYYHFQGNGVRTMNGARARLAYKATQRLMIEGEAQYDTIRKSSFAGGLRYTIPFGRTDEPTPMDELMTQSIVRDIDIITAPRKRLKPVPDAKVLFEENYDPNSIDPFSFDPDSYYTHVLESDGRLTPLHDYFHKHSKSITPRRNSLMSTNSAFSPNGLSPLTNTNSPEQELQQFTGAAASGLLSPRPLRRHVRSDQTQPTQLTFDVANSPLQQPVSFVPIQEDTSLPSEQRSKAIRSRIYVPPLPQQTAPETSPSLATDTSGPYYEINLSSPPPFPQTKTISKKQCPLRKIPAHAAAAKSKMKSARTTLSTKAKKVWPTISVKRWKKPKPSKGGFDVVTNLQEEVAAARPPWYKRLPERIKLRVQQWEQSFKNKKLQQSQS